MVKKTEHGSDLSLHVCPWRDMITDQVDIKNGPKIERHFYTPADLKEMATNAGWQNVPRFKKGTSFTFGWRFASRSANWVRYIVGSAMGRACRTMSWISGTYLSMTGEVNGGYATSSPEREAE